MAQHSPGAESGSQPSLALLYLPSKAGTPEVPTLHCGQICFSSQFYDLERPLGVPTPPHHPRCGGGLNSRETMGSKPTLPHGHVHVLCKWRKPASLDRGVEYFKISVWEGVRWALKGSHSCLSPTWRVSWLKMKCLAVTRCQLSAYTYTGPIPTLAFLFPCISKAELQLVWATT